MRFPSLARLLSCALAAWGLMLASPLPAQEQKPDQQQDQPVTTLSVEVNVVNVFFNVKDKHGALVPDLGKNDFRVVEDGKPQTIKYFNAEVNQPLTLGIMIDTSLSQDQVLPMEKEVGAAFLRDVLRPKDEAFVISFDVTVDLIKDFTNSTRELAKALDSTRINCGGSCGGTGIPGLGGGPIPNNNPRGTLLYDAIYLGAHDKLAPEVGRKAMIILTDGEDQGSQLKINDAIEAAQKADAICYVLLIADRKFGYPMGYHGDKAMRDLAQATGGRVIEAGNNEKKLKDAFDQIAAELRTQYSVGYTPTNTQRDGSFRRVEVKPVKPDLKIQARSGYYAPLAK